MCFRRWALRAGRDEVEWGGVGTRGWGWGSGVGGDKGPSPGAAGSHPTPRDVTLLSRRRLHARPVLSVREGSA